MTPQVGKLYLVSNRTESDHVQVLSLHYDGTIAKAIVFGKGNTCFFTIALWTWTELPEAKPAELQTTLPNPLAGFSSNELAIEQLKRKIVAASENIARTREQLENMVEKNERRREELARMEARQC